MKQLLFILSWAITAFPSIGQDNHMMAEKGTVSISSEAPLEIIKAQSHSLRGVINPTTKAFAFTVNINSFQGFNSDIQRTHFLENYMEQKKYPHATFSGKLIEEIPFNAPGSYTVRAKGELEVHGVRKERIIRGTLVITNGGAYITAAFTVPVADHGIAIPKIVKQKIAEEINVSINIEFAQVQ